MNNFMNEIKIASFLKWAKERKRCLIGVGAVLGVIFVVMLTQMRVLEITSRSVPYKSCIQFYHIKPKVGDLCVVEYKTQDGKTQTLVKYLAGTAGETVTMWNGDIFVNHKRYIGKPNNRRLMPICFEGEEVTIPEGYVFVAGTHEDSLDSRYKEFGFVKVSDIKGKAMPLGEKIEQLSNYQNCNEPRFIHSSAIVEQNVDEEFEAKEQKNKREDEEFMKTLRPDTVEQYKRDKQKQEKLMSRTEIANYDWAKYREEWMQKLIENANKVLEDFARKVAKKNRNDELTRQAKEFVRSQDESKRLERAMELNKIRIEITEREVIREELHNTVTNAILLKNRFVDWFFEFARKRKPNMTPNQIMDLLNKGDWHNLLRQQTVIDVVNYINVLGDAEDPLVGNDPKINKKLLAELRKEYKASFNAQKLKKKAKQTFEHTKSEPLILEDFVRVAQRRNPHWMAKQATKFFLTVSPENQEFQQIMIEMLGQK